jgi:hypothetical protein
MATQISLLLHGGALRRSCRMMRATLHPSARRDMRKGAPVARAPTRRKEHGGAHLSSTDTPKTFRKKREAPDQRLPFEGRRGEGGVAAAARAARATSAAPAAPPLPPPSTQPLAPSPPSPANSASPRTVETKRQDKNKNNATTVQIEPRLLEYCGCIVFNSYNTHTHTRYTGRLKKIHGWDAD